MNAIWGAGGVSSSNFLGFSGLAAGDKFQISGFTRDWNQFISANKYKLAFVCTGVQCVGARQTFCFVDAMFFLRYSIPL